MKGTFLAVLAMAALIAGGLAADPFLFETYETKLRIGGTRDGMRAYSVEQVIKQSGATWIRLFFDKSKTNAPLIRITSLLDGAVQHLNQETLVQWQFSSAYFNGDSVLVEVFDQQGHVSDYAVEVVSIQGGRPFPAAERGEKSLCGPDSRVLSEVKRSGRYLGSGGCTGWLINDKNGCFLTAHHCGTDSTGAGVMEFEVPLSIAGPIQHEIVHPPPEHQYTMDPSSLLRASAPVGVGNDWQYFGCFPNTETGLTPLQRQGESYVLATNLTIPTAGTSTTVVGYGVVEFDLPQEWNQAQKISHGPFSHGTQGSTTWAIHYTVDTTGGDSGSGVEQDGVAIGIHTHGGCSRVFGGTNSGTFIGHPTLQKALSSPAGVCA